MIALAAASASSQTPSISSIVARTPDGAMRGARSDAVDRFLGVAFVEKPARWSPAPRLRRWRGVQSAVLSRSACASPTSGDGPESPYEDCLYLNLYRPANVSARASLPVIVFFHGGGNQWGSPGIYDGERLARVARAIVVIPAYRTGAFGFLALPDGPDGDVGLSDQRAALRWVKRSIGSFGGNPNNVTLAGESAGAADVCSLMAAPSVKGLFARAIMQSGFCHIVTDIAAARRIGSAFAVRAGCSAPVPLPCLQKKSTATLIRAWGETWSDPASDAPLFPTAPIGTATLPLAPLPAASQGGLARVPILMGFNKDELRPFLAARDPLDHERYVDLLSREYRTQAGALLKLYPASEPSAIRSLGALRSDHVMICPTFATADVFAQSMPVAMFRFADETAPRFKSLGAPVAMPSGFNPGAGHTVELQYLLGYRAAENPLSTPQRMLADSMAAIWGIFARQGVSGFWPAYTAENRTAIDIMPLDQGGIKVKTDIYDRHHCAFWQNQHVRVRSLVP